MNTEKIIGNQSRVRRRDEDSVEANDAGTAFVNGRHTAGPKGPVQEYLVNHDDHGLQVWSAEETIPIDNKDYQPQWEDVEVVIDAVAGDK